MYNIGVREFIYTGKYEGKKIKINIFDNIKIVYFCITKDIINIQITNQKICFTKYDKG